MPIIISSSPTIVDVISNRTKYQHESYYDLVDTDISQLITIPDISQLRIQAKNYAYVGGSIGNTRIPSTPDSPFAEQQEPYYPDGNPTNFYYAFMADEHALFYIKTIFPEREVATYRWEVNGQLKSNLPFLLIYNLVPDRFIDSGLTGTPYGGFGTLNEVTCIATNQRGKEIRQSVFYKCDDAIQNTGDGVFPPLNYRKAGKGYYVFDSSKFYGTELSEAERQEPYMKVSEGSDAEIDSVKYNGFTFSEWKAALNDRNLLVFDNAGIDENKFGEPSVLLDRFGMKAASFLELWDNGYKSGTGGGSSKEKNKWPEYKFGEHKLRYLSTDAWLFAIFSGEIHPLWNVRTNVDYPGGARDGIVFNWKV